jgi:tight adherence protein C
VRLYELTAPILAFGAAALGSAGGALLVPARRRGRAADSTAPRVLRLLSAAGSAMRARGATAPLDLEARLLAAGRPAGLGARELMAAKLAAAGCGAGAGTALAAVAPGRLGPLLVVTAPVAAFLGPDLWLARRAEERARRVRRELPSMLDLLRITIEAGASLPAALGAVGDRTEGPLSAEWRSVAREVELGVPLSAALARMRRRLPQAEVHSLVAAVERSTRHGTPLAQALAAQARDARFALRRRVREDAGKAGPKIQLVVALMLVPSVLLLVAAALASALVDSGSLLPA